MPKPPRLGANNLTSDLLSTRAAMSGQLWEARQQARENVVDEFETIDDPQEVPIRRRGRGLGPAPAFIDWAAPQEAAHHLDPQFPRQELGAQDVQRTPEGQFRATEGTRRRSAAREIEETTPLGDVDPFGGLVAQDGGFGLAAGPQRELAAHELDPQLPGVDVGPGDVTQTEQGYRPTADARRQQAAADLDPQLPLLDVGASDVERTDDGFGLTAGAERELAAERIEDQTPLEAVGTDDVTRTDEGFRLRDAVIDENRGLFE